MIGKVRGLAAAIASLALAGCISSGYLETDRPGNVPFYGRFGFRTVAVIPILGVTNTSCVADLSRTADPGPRRSAGSA